MKKTLILLLAFVSSHLAISAQVATFEEMKAQLSDKSLPIINITVEIDKVSKPEYTNADIEIADPERRTDPENVCTRYQCKVKYRGSSSMQYEKKSFNVKLLNDKGKSLDANLFGIRKDDAWILDAMAMDRLRMRNRVNFDIWNEMSATPYSTDYERRNGTKGLFVELFINGKYHGLYCFSDKVNRKLLKIKKAEEGEDGNAAIRGVMYKGEQWGEATLFWGYKEESMYGETWNGWELEYPEDYPSPEAYAPLRDFIDYCATPSDAEFKNGINERFYWQNFVDFHAFLLAEGLRDNHGKNTFMSIADIQKGRCLMVTPWDLDCSLGGNYDGEYYDYMATNDLLISNRLLYRLWSGNVGDYKAAVASRWRGLRKTILSDEAFCARLDAYANALMESGAWKREYDMWNNNPVELRKDLADETEYVKNWYRRNAANLENNIFKGIVSGIDTANKEAAANGKRYAYNIVGQRVGAAYRGLVVIDGKTCWKSH